MGARARWRTRWPWWPPRSLPIDEASWVPRLRNPHRLLEGAPHLGRLAVEVAKALELLAQHRVLLKIRERDALRVRLAPHVGERDRLRPRRIAHDAFRIATVVHGLDLGKEALAHHGDADVARAQVLARAVRDGALADPADEVLVHDVAGDPASVRVLDRASPGRHARLHVGLAPLRHADEEPGHR